ncbi:MAG TPA: glycosyltransferase family 2 protein [Xanthobacteraceae bacterium]
MRVSVIIPTQRRPQMLREAAASVLSQTHKDLELIIVLDAATAAAVAASQAIAAADIRVRLIFCEKRSASAARNAGIAVALGEWVAFLDDDDLWLPEKIERQLSEAEAGDADLVGCGMALFDGDGIIRKIGNSAPVDIPLNEALTIYNFLGASGTMARTRVIRQLGGFDETMRSCEDWDMWRRIGWHHRVAWVPHVLAKYRIHEGSKSRDPARMMRAELRVLLKLTFDTPPKLRRLIGRAWREKFWRESANVYAAINKRSGGRAQKLYRVLRNGLG